jgi:Cu(I)/Ag(I) efflux system membrane fusion protein
MRSIVIAAVVLAGCHADQAKHEEWTCPMHPQYISDKPGDCPICGMKLMKKGKAPTGGEGIELDAQKRRLIGVSTVAVKRAPLGAGLRTTGRVSFDERRVHKVTARFEGYVEKLWADFTGKYVEKGAPLLSIYSPELLATEEELLLASRSQEALARSGLPDAARAARDRLRLYGISDAEIARLEKRGVAERALTLSAPVSGYVTSKSVVAGARVMPNDALFEIVDLSHVWVLADVYENELPRLKLGLKATLTLSYWPDRRWPGRVTFIAPTVDEKTRTVKVRIELDNPKGELKPEMFADVVIDTAAREALVVPEDAVIVTGTRKIVFVGAALERREIQTGVHANGLYEVVSGLKEGDQVAAGASFLLDSEARLRAGGDGGAP